MTNRYLMTLKLYFIKSSMKRAAYMRKKGIFHSIGVRVMITTRKIPLYSKLISIEIGRASCRERVFGFV